MNVLERFNGKESDVKNIFMYGSRVYGNYRADSDYDFVVITTNKIQEQFSDNLININFYTPEEHQARLDGHEISALECFFLSPEYVLKDEKKFFLKFDVSKLRHSLSAKSSNSFVKAKKKLTLHNDLLIGKKSLFHSFRIIHFGIQIATHGKIIDYTECNGLYKEIMNSYDKWDGLFETYKTRYNNLLSEFRLLAPK